MLGGGNRDLMDNFGAFNLGGPFSQPAQDFLNPKQPQTPQANLSQYFQPMYQQPKQQSNVPGTNMAEAQQPRPIR